MGQPGNPKHRARLDATSDAGVGHWNAWRAANPEVIPDLSGAHLLSAYLQYADLRRVSLRGAFLRGAHLYGADLSGADLRDAVMVGANLSRANLSNANLEGAILASATLNEGTIVEGANFKHCKVYGIAAWDLRGTPKDQSGLEIDLDQGGIRLDDLALAQFMHLFVKNARLTEAINAIQSKVVLVLGRFTSKRKPALDGLRRKLSSPEFSYFPVVFDFEKPAPTVLETVVLLARLSRFVIADLSSAKSVLQELQAIVPANPSLPVQPILVRSQREPGMVDFFKAFPWYLPLVRYHSVDDLTDNLRVRLIEPLERAFRATRRKR